MNYEEAFKYLDGLSHGTDRQSTMTLQDFEYGAKHCVMLVPRLVNYPHSDKTLPRLNIMSELPAVPVAIAATRREAYIMLGEKMSLITITDRLEYIDWAFAILCAKYSTPAKGFVTLAAKPEVAKPDFLSVSDKYLRNENYETMGDFGLVVMDCEYTGVAPRKFLAAILDLTAGDHSEDERQISSIAYLQPELFKEYYDHPNTPIAVGFSVMDAIQRLTEKMNAVEVTDRWVQAVEEFSEAIILCFPPTISLFDSQK